MARAPILSRTLFLETLNNGKGQRILDWNAVDTELGTMVEPRDFADHDPTTEKGGTFTVEDVTDTSFDRIQVISHDTFQNQYGTGGGGSLREYNI